MLTLAEIQALQLKTAQFSGDFSCERVPTLDEVLALTKGRINIDADLKTDASDAIKSRLYARQSLKESNKRVRLRIFL